MPFGPSRGRQPANFGKGGGCAHTYGVCGALCRGWGALGRSGARMGRKAKASPSGKSLAKSLAKKPHRILFSHEPPSQGSVSGKFLVGARIKFWTLLGFFSKMVAPAGYPAKKLRIEEHPTENVDQTSQPRADDAAAQNVRQWSRALSQTLHVVCVSALGLAERPGEPHPRNIISLRSGEETRVISLGRGTRAIGAGGSKARVLKIWLRGIDPFAQSAICGHKERNQWCCAPPALVLRAAVG